MERVDSGGRMSNVVEQIPPQLKPAAEAALA